MIYDAIVIGAGNGGLVSALTMQKEGKNVLLIESHNLPGGVATSFKRGRFEFEASLHELCQYGSEEQKGDVRILFDKLGISDKIGTVTINESFHVLTIDSNEEYDMPVGVENFINKMEEYVPNSKTSMTKFFELCEENKRALKYLNDSKGNPDKNVLMNEYRNFMVFAPYPVEKVLDAIKMPKKAKEILSTYWVYLGSPISKLSFTHYASMMYSYINDYPVITKKKSHKISVALLEEFNACGGKSMFLTRVTKLITENDRIKGVITSTGEEFYAKTVIANMSPTTLYSKMLDESVVPKRARQLTNSRKLGARGVCVYLGLNKSSEELGLNNYSYFIYHTMNSDKEFKRMHNLKSDNLVGVVINNAVADASPKGTTILYLTSLIFGECFDNTVTKDNYFDLKDAIAENLINVFEEATKINIKDYIEEIEVATPLTFAHYTNTPSGVIYGYLADKSDNLLPRIMNMKNEQYFKNLYFVGGSSIRLSGYSSAYLSGYQMALLALKQLKEEM